MSELLGKRRIFKEQITMGRQPESPKEQEQEQETKGMLSKGEIKLTKITVIRADGSIEEIDNG